MRRVAALVVALASALAAPAARAEESGFKEEFHLEVYGFAWLAAGYQVGRSDPKWFDVMRPSKLESFENEFGDHGETFFSVRPSRLGVKADIPTKIGLAKAIFEFEFFGTGVDAGQTTFRLRHAYGEVGFFGAGQYWSVFMDPDVFPNSLEYWGPNGMVFFRNIQVRVMPLRGDLSMTLAAERPGASADKGDFADTPELEEVVGRFPYPDVTAQVSYKKNKTYLRVAGIIRPLYWDDVGTNAVNLSGHDIGWGVNVSSNVALLNRLIFRLQFVYGEGIANYMNDAGDDVGVEMGTGGKPVGKAIPNLGIVGFVDINWTEQFASSLGYSYVQVDNTSGQGPSAKIHIGHYALGNILWTPVPDVMFGVEGQYGRRENNSDGWNVDDFRVQFTAKFSFSASIGPKHE